METGKISAEDLDIVYAARDFIDANLERHYVIPDLARRLGVNECRLKTNFQHVMGKGLFEYLMYRRLVLVRDEIMRSREPLKTFYRQAGYNSLASFITGFRKHLGCTPGALRRQ